MTSRRVVLIAAAALPVSPALARSLVPSIATWPSLTRSVACGSH